MKTLKELGLEKDGGFEGNSLASGMAIELGYALSPSDTELALRLSEFALSYCNLRLQALRSYGRMVDLLLAERRQSGPPAALNTATQPR